MGERYLTRLAFDPTVSESSPVVRGTYVTADQVVSRIVDRWTWVDIRRAYHGLTDDDIRACLSYAVEESDEKFAEIKRAAAARPAPGGDDELRRVVEQAARWLREQHPDGFALDTFARSYTADILEAADLMRRDGDRAVWLDPAPPEPDDEASPEVAQAEIENVALLRADGYEREGLSDYAARIRWNVARVRAARSRKDTSNNGG